MARPVTVYFDNSVLEPIAAQDAGGRIKKLFKEHGAVGFASIQNLIEFFRIELDDEQRGQRIRTLLQVARLRETVPIFYQDIRGVVGEISRHHPEWINRNPREDQIRKELNDAKLVWQRLKLDHHHRPPGFFANRRWLRDSIGELKRRQRSLGRNQVPGNALSMAVLNPSVDASFKPLFDALPLLEAHWRETTALAYWSALDSPGDQLVSNIKDWLAPYIFFERIDFEGWMRFWLLEVDGAALPRVRVEGLTAYFQVKVESGNAGDVEHSGYAVGRDWVFTADREFHRILTLVKQEVGGMAQPVLVERTSANIVGGITSAMGWN